jgi:hypothetical protein
MFRNMFVVIITVLFMLGFSLSQSSTEIIFGVDAGYFHPMGDWTSHRYVLEGSVTDIDLKQFQGSYVFIPEFEIKFSDISLALYYNYTKLSASDWENYANVSVSSSMSQLGLFIRYFFLNSKPNLMNLEIGMNYIFLNGKERYIYSYDYDFLTKGLGFTFGLGYRYAVNERLSLVANVRVLWRPEGIKYPAGKAYDIFGIYFTPGIKLKIR